MIAYLIHTGVISDDRIGWMGVMGNDGTRHHPNTRVKMGHSFLSLRVSPDKVWTTLLSPLTFHIGTSGDYGVGLVVHAGKVGDNGGIGVKGSWWGVTNISQHTAGLTL